MENPSRLGVVLWLSVVDVSLWGKTGPDARPSLFHVGASATRQRFIAEVVNDADLAARLNTIAAMLELPESVTGTGIAVACSDVAQWAAVRNLPKTAVAFHEAAAAADPADPWGPLHVGLGAAAVGQFARAETWLRYAIGIARRAGERVVYARAAAGLARTLLDAGHEAEAERQARIALRASRRCACGTARGEALYVLFRCALAQGDAQKADLLTVRVLRALGPVEHDLVPFVLVHSARSLLDRGEAKRALAVVVSMPVLPAGHPLVPAKWALLGRVYAMTGERVQFTWSWSRAWVNRRQVVDRRLAQDVANDLLTAAKQAGDRRREERVVRFFATTSLL